MNINAETDSNVDLQVGHTSLGMVRLYLTSNDLEIPMDFSPEEADEIAEEIKAAAKQARNIKIY